jgi:hypothetical protein
MDNTTAYKHLWNSILSEITTPFFFISRCFENNENSTLILDKTVEPFYYLQNLPEVTSWNMFLQKLIIA